MLFDADMLRPDGFFSAPDINPRAECGAQQMAVEISFIATAEILVASATGSNGTRLMSMSRSSAGKTSPARRWYWRPAVRLLMNCGPRGRATATPGKPHDGARIMRHIEDILNALICYVLTIVTQVVVFLSLDKSRPRWKIAWRLALAVVSLTRR